MNRRARTTRGQRAAGLAAALLAALACARAQAGAPPLVIAPSTPPTSASPAVVALWPTLVTLRHNGRRVHVVSGPPPRSGHAWRRRHGAAAAVWLDDGVGAPEVSLRIARSDRPGVARVAVGPADAPLTALQGSLRLQAEYSLDELPATRPPAPSRPGATPNASAHRKASAATAPASPATPPLDAPETPTEPGLAAHPGPPRPRGAPPYLPPPPVTDAVPVPIREVLRVDAAEEPDHSRSDTVAAAQPGAGDAAIQVPPTRSESARPGVWARVLTEVGGGSWSPGFIVGGVTPVTSSGVWALRVDAALTPVHADDPMQVSVVRISAAAEVGWALGGGRGGLALGGGYGGILDAGPTARVDRGHTVELLGGAFGRWPIGDALAAQVQLDGVGTAWPLRARHPDGDAFSGGVIGARVALALVFRLDGPETISLPIQGR